MYRRSLANNDSTACLRLLITVMKIRVAVQPRVDGLLDPVSYCQN